MLCFHREQQSSFCHSFILFFIPHAQLVLASFFIPILFFFYLIPLFYPFHHVYYLFIPNSFCYVFCLSILFSIYLLLYFYLSSFYLVFIITSRGARATSTCLKNNYIKNSTGLKSNYI